MLLKVMNTTPCKKIKDSTMQKKKVSVIIPTLQKNKTILTNLIHSLDKDGAVSEIILIDNSCKRFSHPSDKLKVILPKENLYVNPSWNLGVELAKSDICTLLNDDIIIPEDFCKGVIAQMSPDMGIVGMNGKRIEPIDEDDTNKSPEKSDIYLEPASYMDYYYGIVMFFYKNSYSKIPDGIKIVYGDSWIFTSCKKQKKQNYRICGCTVYHWGSLSSGIRDFNPIAKKNSKIYKKLTVKWYNRLFSYEELWDYHKFRILGLTLRFKKETGGRSYAKIAK